MMYESLMNTCCGYTVLSPAQFVSQVVANNSSPQLIDEIPFARLTWVNTIQPYTDQFHSFPLSLLSFSSSCCRCTCPTSCSFEGLLSPLPFIVPSDIRTFDFLLSLSAD
jgi:hypothetical protein